MKNIIGVIAVSVIIIGIFVIFRLLKLLKNADELSKQIEKKIKNDGLYKTVDKYEREKYKGLLGLIRMDIDLRREKKFNDEAKRLSDEYKSEKNAAERYKKIEAEIEEKYPENFPVFIALYIFKLTILTIILFPVVGPLIIAAIKIIITVIILLVEHGSLSSFTGDMLANILAYSYIKVAPAGIVMLCVILCVLTYKMIHCYVSRSNKYLKIHETKILLNKIFYVIEFVFFTKPLLKDLYLLWQYLLNLIQ